MCGWEWMSGGAGSKPDTYTLAESGPSGYTAGAWSCTGGTQNGSTITVGLGQSATCTINNNDNAPALHLRKTVTNDNGGTAAGTAWTLSATGTGDRAGHESGVAGEGGGVGGHADIETKSERGQRRVGASRGSEA